MNKQQIIEKLTSIKPYLQEQFGITELALFGSYSRDEQTSDSDIDIMVEYKKSMGMRFLDMVYELDDLFKQKVEVVSKQGIKPKYFKAIENDLIYV